VTAAKSLGHLLKVAVTCTKHNKRWCYRPFSLSLVCNELHKSLVGIATHFLGIFTVSKFGFVILCFFVTLVFFIMKSSTFP